MTLITARHYIFPLVCKAKIIKYSAIELPKMHIAYNIMAQVVESTIQELSTEINKSFNRMAIIDAKLNKLEEKDQEDCDLDKICDNYNVSEIINFR